MTPDATSQSNDQATPIGPPPLRTLALTILTLLIEAAAANLGAGVPSVGDPTAPTDGGKCDLREARLAIDGANALLAAMGRALSSDERLAIEGLLTQLQVEYVKRSGA